MKIRTKKEYLAIQYKRNYVEQLQKFLIKNEFHIVRKIFNDDNLILTYTYKNGLIEQIEIENKSIVWINGSILKTGRKSYIINNFEIIKR